MSELLLSFIMPTFNSSEYLAKTMDSLIASIGQHSSSVEIICVDDGSTDSTVAILEEYKSVFDNLIIIRNSHGGVSQARNTALDVVSGTFISFVDSDDLFEENFLDIFLNIEKRKILISYLQMLNIWIEIYIYQEFLLKRKSMFLKIRYELVNMVLNLE